MMQQLVLALLLLLASVAGLGACSSSSAPRPAERQTVEVRAYDVATQAFVEGADCGIVRAGMEIAKVKSPQPFQVLPNHKPLVISCRRNNACGTDTLRPLVPKDAAPSLAQVIDPQSGEAEDDAAFGYPASTTVFMRTCKK